MFKAELSTTHRQYRWHPAYRARLQPLTKMIFLECDGDFITHIGFFSPSSDTRFREKCINMMDIKKRLALATQEIKILALETNEEPGIYIKLAIPKLHIFRNTVAVCLIIDMVYEIAYPTVRQMIVWNPATNKVCWDRTQYIDNAHIGFLKISEAREKCGN